VPQSDRLVTVARYDSQGDARLAQTRLEDAGIACMVANADQAGLAMLFDPSRGGVQVKVPADRADAARALLDAEA
jgi:hypothetical protein